MDADSFSIVDNRAGVTFGVELYVPWDAPEMVVDLSSASTVPLRNVPYVFGMVGHWRRCARRRKCNTDRNSRRSVSFVAP